MSGLLCLVALEVLTSSVSAGKCQLRRRVGHLPGSNLLISPTEMVVRLLLLSVLVEVVSVASRLVSPTKPIASLPPSFFRPETSLKLPETSRPSCRSSGSLPSAAPLICTKYSIRYIFTFGLFKVHGLLLARSVAVGLSIVLTGLY